ncbi:MAG: PAS domain S-box protein [Betaproteobacteria bacterium]
MHRLTVAIVLVLFATGAALALTRANQGAAQQQTSATQAKKDTLVVGSEQDFPPFATGMTDETASGFTVDLWKAVAAEFGLHYTIRVLPFHQILQEFKQGKIDVLINLAQSDERRQFADLTVPHVVVHGAIFVRKGESSIHSEEDFSGKSIIVLNADLAHDYAVSKGWGKQLVLVDTSAAGLRLLASGKHDAMLLSKLTGVQTLQALGLTNVVALNAKAGFSQKFTFAVPKGQSALLAKLNEGMAIAKSNGTYNTLYEKWFGIYETKESSLIDLLKYITPLLAIFLIVGGWFFYRRKVERQESETKLQTLYAAIDQTPVSVLIANVDGNIEYVNPFFTKITGYSAHEAMGQNPRILQSGFTPNETFQALWGKVTSGQIWHGELANKRKNGEIYWEDAHIAPVKSEDGVLTHYVAAKVDITQRKIDQQRMVDLLAEQKVILENILISIVRVKNRNIVWANPAFEKMLGYSPGELAGKSTRNNFVSEEAYSALGAAAYPVLNAGMVFRTQIEHVRKDGNRIWVDVSGSFLDRDNGESLWGFIDITDRKQVEQKLAESEKRMELALAGADLGLWDQDIKSGTIAYNSRFVTMLGYVPNEVDVNIKTFVTFLHPEDIPTFNANYFSHLKAKTPEFQAEYRVRHKDGHWVWLLSRGKVMERDGNGRAVRMTGTSLDITDRKVNEAKVHDLAFYDPLTHLPNRRLLMDRLGLALPSSARRNTYGAILFLDLDNFKTLNDTRGHDVGDQLLVEVARRLLSFVRAEDTVARLGGDEFVVTLEDLSPHKQLAQAQAEAIAEKIRAALGEPYSLQDYNHNCTSSIGICLFKGLEVNLNELLKRADLAMYQAKAAGRNTIQFSQNG